VEAEKQKDAPEIQKRDATVKKVANTQKRDATAKLIANKSMVK
jgi:hypothetical protein